MPLGCRNIEPSRLGAHDVPQELDADKKCVLFSVANNAIVGTLLQLSSLVRHADDIFCDLSDECQRLVERTNKITKRIHRLDDRIGKLDAKQAVIPEGDLKQFTTISDHHVTRHGYDSNMFVSTNRPQCIQDMFTLCAPNPTRVIRSADAYRKDGLNGSIMFKCWPIIVNDQKIRTPDLNLPRSVKRVRSFEKKYKQPRIRERPKTIHGYDDFNLQDAKKEMSKDNENKDEESASEPPVVVSIDTSGSNFERMQSLRSSGRRYQTKEEQEKKKRRRRTVAGVENILGEIEKFDRKKKACEGRPRQTPRSYSFDDLDAEDDIERDEAMLKYFDEIDGKMEERMGVEKAQKIMKFFPCRRAKSLPRCIKLPSVARSLSAERRSQKDFNTTYGSSSLSIPSLASSVSSRLSRSTKRSSIIGNKIKSLVTGQKDKPKQRPKSLDIDTFFDSKSKPRCSIEEQERSKSTYSLERRPAPTIPDNLLNKEHTARSSSTIGPGSYYNFENSTLPRTKAKKYDFPWESLPKDWTTSVKLREISKRREREDRQSSSGNWSQSGTNSNRQSLDSDLRSEAPAKFTSQYSLGKDSGRDSLTLEEENDCVTDGTSTAGYAADSQSTITGDSVSIGNPKSDFTQLDTEAWIQSLAIRAAKEEAENPNSDKSSTLSRLTRQNILALDLMLADGSQKPKGDEESSIYSVDQEGFYTSFHNDSGLRKSTNTLVDEDTCDFSPSKDTASVCSADSVIHRTPCTDKFAGLRKGNNTKVLSKVTPPLPPVRSSSTKTDDSDKCLVVHTAELHSLPSQGSSSSVSESDAEAVFTRVHEKTNLTSTGFPSLVALSTSDDESSPEAKTDKNRVKVTGLYSTSFGNKTGSDLGLSNITCASQFSSLSHSSANFDGFNSSSPSLKHSTSVLECTAVNQGYDNIVPDSSKHNKTEAGYQSWPRSRRNQTGILKTPKTPEKQFDVLRPPKQLNFAPVVNLFKEGALGSVQMPLPSPTNSSCSESNNTDSSGYRLSSFQSTDSSIDQSYNLAVPIKDKAKVTDNTGKQDLPMKYQPVITVTPRARSRSGERKSSSRDRLSSSKDKSSRPVIYASTNNKPSAQSTPHAPVNGSSSRKQASPNLYAVSPVMAPKEPSRQNSNSSLSSNGSAYMDMHSMKSAGSSSSLASSESLNFKENSTYMSMSSPNSSPNLSNMDFSISSTPAGSMDSLLDLRKTPTNELENDTYQINTNLHPHRSNGYNGVVKPTPHHSSVNGTVDTVPIVTQNGNRGYTNGHANQSKQAFASFRAPDTTGSASKYTPGRRSLDSTDGDLTQVTQMSFNSSMGSVPSPVPQNVTTVNREVSSAGRQQPRQTGRQSRADTRKEPSYRNPNASNRRSLPSDMSGTGVQIRHVPLNDTRPSAKSNQNLHHQSPQNSMSSSKSCPLGFNSVLLSNSSYNSGHLSANSHRNTGAPGTYTGAPGTYIPDHGDPSSRTDSYRVAVGSNKTSSYRNATMPQSKSFPLLPPSTKSGPYRVAMDMSPNRAYGNNVDDDVLSRADSYRIAVRNTNGLVPDMANRNSSYRVALNDEIPVINPKLEALSMDNTKSASGRDARRMGITDVDQVKDIKAKPQTMKHSASAPQVQMRNRAMKSPHNTRAHQAKNDVPSAVTDKKQTGRIRKVTTHDVDPIEVVQTVDTNPESRKTGKNNPNRSSTYIQFDPIFEDGEDWGAPNAADMDMSSMDYSKNLSTTSKSKFSLINGTIKDANANTVNGKAPVNNKAPVSNKAPKHAGKNTGIEIEDNWRFSQV